MSLDEYSSLRYKGYLNINVRQDKDKFCNLGMVAISGCMTAEKIVEVENKLSEFSLSLSRHIYIAYCCSLYRLGECYGKILMAC